MLQMSDLCYLRKPQLNSNFCIKLIGIEKCFIASKKLNTIQHNSFVKQKYPEHISVDFEIFKIMKKVKSGL